MKPMQLLIATAISTVLLLLWGLFYWQLVVSTVDINPADKPQLERVERAMSEIREMAQPLTQNQEPHFLAQQDSSWTERLLYGSVLYGVLSFVIGLVVVITGLHRSSIVQRLLAVTCIGFLGALVLRLSDPRWLSLPWQDSFLTGLYELVFWIILGLVAALQLRVKKRNIFRS